MLGFGLITKSYSARHLEPRNLGAMQGSLAQQLAGFRKPTAKPSVGAVPPSAPFVKTAEPAAFVKAKVANG